MNQWHEFIVHPQIIPTVLIPLTAASVLLSSIAVFIAGLFGIKLKADGPRKLLEVLIKPKVLISACLVNIALWGGYKGFVWFRNAASLDQVVAFRQARLAKPSTRVYVDNLQLLSQYEFSTKSSAHRFFSRFKLDSVWQAHLPKGSFSEPTLSGSSLFVGSENGYVYEIDKNSGGIERKFFIGTPVTPRVLIYNGYLYAGEGTHDIHHARVSKFDLKSGAFVGSFRTLGHIEGQMTIDVQDGHKSLLLVSGGRGGFYAIDPDSMQLVWNSTIGHSDTGARADGDLVYFATGREKNLADSNRSWAVAANRASGDIVWRRELPASSWMLPMIRGNEACFVFGEVYFKSDFGGIACFDKKSGGSSRTYLHPAPIASHPIVVDDDFFVTDLNGQTCRINSKAMTSKWCREGSDESYSLAGLRYDKESASIVKASRNAEILVLDPETGAERFNWRQTPGKKGRAYAPVLIDGDSWFFVDLEGNVTRLAKHADALTSRQ